MMKTGKSQPSRDLRDIGQVTPLADKLHLARELSSCCVGVEALLETDRALTTAKKRRALCNTTSKTEQS